MLPPSDLAHRADLVCVLLRGELAPAALVVAPAGILRYWPNIAHEDCSIDALADLHGEECCSLTNTEPLGCIVATTTSSLMLVTPSTIEGQTTLLIKPLKTPQGLLTGIGQQVSSFIFGTMPAQLEARYLAKVLVEPTMEEGGKYFYVLLRNSLQKWFLKDKDPEKLCGECDLDRCMKEQFHETVWNGSNTLPMHLKAWCIDMQLPSNGVAILMAALNPHVSQRLYYAIGTVDIRSLGSPADRPASFTDFTVLRFQEQYTEKDEEALLSYKFVLPSAMCPSSFVYSGTKVYCVMSGSDVGDLDVIEFKKDKLLGAGCYEETPLFFSRVNGIVCIRSVHATARDARSQLHESPLHQSQVLEETANHVVEIFGTELPVLVSEALIEAEPGTDITTRISSCGWAWLVCGRKLCVWQYKKGLHNRNCHVLMLPPSDLAHRADLVCVLLRGQLAPAALVVAPAGILRYWPNIAHEDCSIDALADLHGEECCSLTNTEPLGCIVATTTSSLMLVTPSTIEGQTTLLIKPLKTPQGLLTGIGQQVSSFIFGTMPAQLEARYLAKVLVEPTMEEGGKYFYVLLRNSLQKWFLKDKDPEKLCGECDLDRCMKEQFHETVWNGSNTLPMHLKAWCIDMQLPSNGVAILMAALNPHVSQRLYYAIGTVDVRSLGSPADCPASFTDFTVLRFQEQYTEKDEEALLSYKFVLPSAMCPSSFVYSGTKVYCVMSGSDVGDLDVIEFKKDKLLGAGCYEETPLFFSRVNGIVCIRSVHATARDASLAMELMPECPYSLADDETMEGISVDERNLHKLRSAFALFCQNELLKSQEIVNNIFPRPVELFRDLDSALDTCVSQLGYWLMDGVPVMDPRWTQLQFPGGSVTVSSASLLIHRQLEDKLQAHQLFLNFLKAVHLWPRLYAVTVRGSPMATNLLLQEQAEKLVAAMELHSLQAQFNTIIDAGIRRVIQECSASTPGGLTAADYFYRKVSELDKIFPALVEEEEDQLKMGLSPRDEFALITNVNTIFVWVLRDVCLFRDREQLTYECARETSLEFRPWTTILRDIICKQHTLATTNAIAVAENATSFGQVFLQLTDLADLILNGHKVQLDSLTHNQAAYEALKLQYQQDRRHFIAPLIKATQYERAATLAEKHCDFESLVEICELTRNKERLESYMVLFKDQGFPEFVFQWQLDSGRRGELLDQPASQHGNLERFLEGHDSLSWLHDIHLGKMGKAATTLHRLGQQEEQNMLRKKYLLSHSKLAALCSDDPPETHADLIKNINREEALITYQESLPFAVKEAYCLEPRGMKVLGPEELIEMYISTANLNANEYDFTKALEILDFIEDPTRAQELRMRIWCAAILRNKWENLDTDNVEGIMKDRLFFRIADLGVTQGRNLAQYLPPLEGLLEMPDLQDLRSNHHFLFILGAGYEHLQRMAAIKTSLHQA
ncbi:nuclear pore complex protein Nup133-like isoform X2 [Amblyomma americanum]